VMVIHERSDDDENDNGYSENSTHIYFPHNRLDA
jgi:hypothetical protein